MTTSSDPTCAWVGERIEGFVDGDLAALERTQVARHASACRECAREIDHARSLRAELRALPVFAAPPAVLERAADAIARTESQRAGPRGESAILPGRRRRAARWAAAAAAIATASWLWWWAPARAPHAPAEDAETEAAVRDLNLALATVQRTARRTTALVGAEIAAPIERAIRASQIDAIRKRVAPPLRRALEEQAEKGRRES